jgi:tRNA-Thr(GGU) m(6)t(6)A37 methyltransferase TsaA
MPPYSAGEVTPVARVHSSLTDPSLAPKQGHEGAPEARVEILPDYVEALDGIEAGDEIVLLTWFHRADREVLKVHPRDDPGNPLTGVFATRSADRPNPIGLHRVEVLEVEDGRWLTVRGLEAIDGTPVIDIKPVIEPPGF